jgi:hypothetical protein
MKKLVIIAMLSGLVVGGTGFFDVDQGSAYAQKKDDKRHDDRRHKDPVGPPVVRDKGPKGEKPKEPPRKGKRPPN